MGKLIALAITLGLLGFPSVNYGQSAQTVSAPPPIAQPLVREGSLALHLAEALKMGPATSEPEAENLLSAAGIIPENGWIADYPVTPVTIRHLQSAVAEAADSKRIPLTREEALEAFENLVGNLGLAVAFESSEPQGSGEPPKDYPQYVVPEAVDSYYYDRGPPVVTYYLPPPRYTYLYSWVPYPFFYTDFFFGGFFILRDFHKVIILDRRRTVVSNHVFHPKSRRHFSVGPHERFKRHHGVSSFRADRKFHPGRGFRSPADRRAAQSILDRSHRRHASHPGAVSLPRGSFRGAAGRESAAGRLSPESGARGGAGERNSGIRREKATTRRDGIGRRSFQAQGGSGTHRSFNAYPRSGPAKAFRAPTPRSAGEFSRRSAGRSRDGSAFTRGFSGRSRGGSLSVRGGGGRGGTCGARC